MNESTNQQSSNQRQVASKVCISDIINNKYIKEEGWLPNYVLIGDRKISRANIIGVIVSSDPNENSPNMHNYIMDDGSGRIPLRFFESPVSFSVGDIVKYIKLSDVNI